MIITYWNVESDFGEVVSGYIAKILRQEEYLNCILRLGLNYNSLMNEGIVYQNNHLMFRSFYIE